MPTKTRYKSTSSRLQRNNWSTRSTTWHNSKILLLRIRRSILTCMIRMSSSLLWCLSTSTHSNTKPSRYPSKSPTTWPWRVLWHVLRQLTLSSRLMTNKSQTWMTVWRQMLVSPSLKRSLAFPKTPRYRRRARVKETFCEQSRGPKRVRSWCQTSRACSLRPRTWRLRIHHRLSILCQTPRSLSTTHRCFHRLRARFTLKTASWKRAVT